MTISISPTSTLNTILEESFLSNQTLVVEDVSIDVNKSVLASSSTFFRSLWFLEFADKNENPLDFSNLNVDADVFLSFIKSFYGQSFTLTNTTLYCFFYLSHYFQVETLIEQVEAQLQDHLQQWSWLKEFIKEADQRDDFRALEVAGPFFSKTSDLLIDDVMLFPFNQWEEFLFVPLNDVKEVESILIAFHFKKLKRFYVDSLVDRIQELETEKGVIVNDYETKIIDLQSELDDVKSQVIKLENSTILFSTSRKHPRLVVSSDQKTLTVNGSDSFVRNILGDKPLLPGNVYTWKVTYSGCKPGCLVVGVIDEGVFSPDTNCHGGNCHGVINNSTNCGRVCGSLARWDPHQVLEFTANMIDCTLSIKAIGNNCSINLSGTLPTISSCDRNYYPFFRSSYPNIVVQLID
ncbi:hypothetical protein GEMRC1_004995 [Eukaryota sp. GEM-RC1]